MIAEERSNSERSSLFDASLIDDQLSAEEGLVASSSAMDRSSSLASFEEILQRDQDMGNHHSGSTVELFSTKVKEFSESACDKGGLYVKDAQVKAIGCAVTTKDQVGGYIQAFFSPEQENARAEMVRNAVTIIRTGLSSCHDGVDTLLVKVFDQPVEEVEVRQSIEEGPSVSFNEDITIDSALKRSEQDDVILIPVNGENPDAPQRYVVKKEISRRVRLASIKKQGNKQDNKDQMASVERTPDHAEEYETFPTIPSMDVQSISTTESDIESLLRFKEQLYSLTDNREEAQGPADELDENLHRSPVDKESRNGAEAWTSASVDELDRALRTDIEKLDRMVGKGIKSIERSSGSDMLKINESSSTPLRGNLGTRDEAGHKMHHVTRLDPAGHHVKEGPTHSTMYFPAHKAHIRAEKIASSRVRKQPVDDVIDLTMYAEETF